VGTGYKACFKRKGISFRSLSRSEVDYTNLNALTAALRAVHEALERDLRNWTKCGLTDDSSLDTQNQPLKPGLTMRRGAESDFIA
jgi:hypothetical protein